jgi:hypothetical protein
VDKTAPKEVIKIINSYFEAMAKVLVIANMEPFEDRLNGATL